MSRTVLVLGATGNQGGAVARALLSLGMEVSALVRDPASAKARALASAGAVLVQGDFDHGDSIEAAAQGKDAVFVVTSPFVPGVGLEGEVRQGRTIIAALERAQPGHVVYSSVSDADRATGVPHFDTKADAERALAASTLRWTITAPVFFSDNLLMPWTLPALKQGTLRQAMPASRSLQVVSLGEIGRFNAAVIARGPELAGRRINFAGDELSPAAMAEQLSSAAGTAVAFEEQPLAEINAFSEDTGKMYAWFDAEGYTADIDGLRAEFPEVGWLRFRDWAQAQPWPELLA